jgi:hypothetical protein
LPKAVEPLNPAFPLPQLDVVTIDELLGSHDGLGARTVKILRHQTGRRDQKSQASACAREACGFANYVLLHASAEVMGEYRAYLGYAQTSLATARARRVSR